MVVDFGMSERVGHVSFNLSRGRNDSPVFDKPYSDTMAQTIDEEVKLIIDEVRQRAHKLLGEKRDKLEELAQVLLEKEVLGPKELVDILGERPHGEYVSYNGSASNDKESEKGEPEALTSISGDLDVEGPEQTSDPLGDGM